MDAKRTALVLGGGGSRGAYEAGVWKALDMLGIKIDIVTGTSVGAINAAMVAQGDLELDLEMWKKLETDQILDVSADIQPVDYLKELIVNQGAGSSGLKDLLGKYVDEDLIRNSPIEFGITAVSVPDLKLHKMFKENIPKGKMKDYILASASAYPAIHSHKIDGVEYIDGGYRDVIPMDMALEKNPTHVICVNLRGYGIIDVESVQKAPNLKWIECPWKLGAQFIFDTDHARKLINLGYLDTLKAYKILDGRYFAFAKGTFNKPNLRMADCAGKVFGVDPTKIYTEEVFVDAVREAVTGTGNELQKAAAQYAGSSVKSFADAGERLTEMKRLIKAAGNIKNVSEDIKQVMGDKFMTFAIANHLKEKGVNSIYLTRPAFALMSTQIQAARFLIKHEIL